MIVEMIRHGQVPGNLEHRYVGTTEEHLTLQGAEDARQMAARRNRTPSPDIVFTSPRVRCMETAKILFPEVEPTVIDGLAECDFGTFEYKNYKELAGDPDYQAWIDSGGTIGFPGGEDMQTYRDRSTAAFLEAVRIAEAEQAERAVMVVHGGTIMAVMAELAVPEGDYFTWQCGNLEGYRGIWQEGKILGSSKLRRE